MDATSAATSRDRPIEKRQDDLLERAPFADAIARQLLSIDARDGAVVALVGPWGSGKTSILNLVDEGLAAAEKAIVVRFNPWFFSGSEDLIAIFLRELANQLPDHDTERYQAASEALRRYARIASPLLSLVPVAGKPLSGAADFLERFLSETKSIYEQRAELDAELRKLGIRVVVLLDDIDRLHADEIRDVVRLVRLTADFPNTIYLLAFDRVRVEAALASEDPKGGRAYLEKVIQIVHDVPATREVDIARTLATQIDDLLTSDDLAPFETSDLQNVFSLVIRPMFRSIRDIKRFVNAVPVTLQVIGDEVNPVDVLALEATRVLLPEVYEGLAAHPDLLTATAPLGGHGSPSNDSATKDFITHLVSLGGDRQEVVQELIIRLFPAAAGVLGQPTYGSNWLPTWRRGRRVAHHDVLGVLLNRSLPPGMLPSRIIQRLFEALDEPQTLSELLAPMDSETFQQALERLEDYEDQFPTGHVAEATAALLNKYPQIPQFERSGMFGFGPELYVSRVVLRLLRRLEDGRARRDAVQNAIRLTSSLSAQLRLVRLAGNEENVGSNLIDEAAAAQFESELEERILATQASLLAQERDLGLILAWILDRDREGKSAVLRLLEDDAVFAQFLGSLLSESKSQSMGDVAITYQRRLPWEWLTGILDQGLLCQRASQILVLDDLAGVNREAALLALDYCAGRIAPSEF